MRENVVIPEHLFTVQLLWPLFWLFSLSRHLLYSNRPTVVRSSVGLELPPVCIIGVGPSSVALETPSISRSNPGSSLGRVERHFEGFSSYEIGVLSCMGNWGYWRKTGRWSLNCCRNYCHPVHFFVYLLGGMFQTSGEWNLGQRKYLTRSTSWAFMQRLGSESNACISYSVFW